MSRHKPALFFLTNILIYDIIKKKKGIINYRFLYFIANDKKRPIFEVWADTKEELFNICLILNKIKQAKINYGLISTVKKQFQPVPCPYIRQKDNKFHAYIIITLA